MRKPAVFPTLAPSRSVELALFLAVRQRHPRGAPLWPQPALAHCSWSLFLSSRGAAVNAESISPRSAAEHHDAWPSASTCRLRCAALRLRVETSGTRLLDGYEPSQRVKSAKRYESCILFWGASLSPCCSLALLARSIAARLQNKRTQHTRAEGCALSNRAESQVLPSASHAPVRKACRPKPDELNETDIGPREGSCGVHVTQFHVIDGVHDRGAFRGFGLVVKACIFDL